MLGHLNFSTVGGRTEIDRPSEAASRTQALYDGEGEGQGNEHGKTAFLGCDHTRSARDPGFAAKTLGWNRRCKKDSNRRWTGRRFCLKGFASAGKSRPLESFARRECGHWRRGPVSISGDGGDRTSVRL